MDQNPIPAPDARTLRVARRASTGGGLAPPQAPILGMPPNANMPGAQREPQPHQFEAAAAAVAAAARRAAQPADQGIGHLDLPLAPSPVPLPADPPDPPGQPPAGPANPPPPPDDDYAGMTLEQARARLNGLWANRHTAGNTPPAPAGTAPTEQTGPAPALRELEDELRQRAHPELRLRLNAAFLPRRDETPPLGYQEALAAAAAAEAGDSPAFFTARDRPASPSPLGPTPAPRTLLRPEQNTAQVGAETTDRMLGQIMQLLQSMQTSGTGGLQQCPAPQGATPAQQPQAGPLGENPGWQGFANPGPQARHATTSHRAGDREVPRSHESDGAPDPGDPSGSSEDSSSGHRRRHPLPPRPALEPRHSHSSHARPARSVPPPPKFTGAEGALPNIKHYREGLTWFTSHIIDLKGHPKQQYISLLSSLIGSPPAVAFLDSIRDEFKAICPAGAKYVDRTTTRDGVTDFTSFFAENSMGSNGSSTTATTVYGKSSRSPMECFQAAAAKVDRDQEQGGGSRFGVGLGLCNEREWRELHGNETFPDPMVAFLRIVLRRKTKPGPQELKVWTAKGSMFKGVPNDIDQDVPVNETPLAYASRVVATYQTLTLGAPEAFRECASSHSPPQKFLDGLPENFPHKGVLRDKLRDIDVALVNEF